MAELGIFPDVANELQKWSFLRCKSSGMIWNNDIESAKSMAELKR